MKSFKLSLIFILITCFYNYQVFSQATQPTFNAGEDPKPTGKKWVLVNDLSDEFDGSELDLVKWKNTDPTAWIGRPPGIFKENVATVGGGNLRLTNYKLSAAEVVNGNTFTHAGGNITSQKAAQVGYYTECSMKANKTFMSSTFWLINKRNEGQNCDQRTIELDIQECVGTVTSTDSWPQNKFREMGSNTHSRNTSCPETPVGSKGDHVDIGGAAYDDYHVYAAWWKSKSEILFYLDGEYVFTVNPVADFDLPMYLRMVTETYDWNPVPSDGGMTGSWNDRTTFYDWVRTWKLEDTTDAVSLNSAPSKVVTSESFDVSISYVSSSQNDILAIVNDPSGAWLTNAKTTVQAGSGAVTLTVNQDTDWNVANGYKLGIAIRPVGGDFSSNLDYSFVNFDVTADVQMASLQNQGSFNFMSATDPNKMSNKATAGTTEQFQIIDIGDGKVALKGSNGKYVSSENGTKEMTCTRTEIGAWEKFTLIDYGNNIYALKGNNNLYLRDNMLCTSTGVSDWQRFKITYNNSNARISNSSSEFVDEFILSPNPVHSKLRFSKITSGKYQLTIYNSVGKQMKTEFINVDNQMEINISDLKQGVYILQLQNEAINKTVRFVKE
ncbi:T9SS type A sorting domain-containing protein [Sediminitomix flava]|uniref:Putative secreted protein (Por secretion system target) n=1 Tax=Sediminitomix flava TaxID=379075 RepID=A0A315Z5X9_SEDFL|nr:T9SS type A sorting domain-containing protein [Sediminitomix flava]PWJ39308.1 putative secreted protein (Por secretion system target) [Sediminitomix flava]